MKKPKIVFCSKGHIYDAAIHDICPYCKKIQDEQGALANSLGDDMEENSDAEKKDTATNSLHENYYNTRIQDPFPTVIADRDDDSFNQTELFRTENVERRNFGYSQEEVVEDLRDSEKLENMQGPEDLEDLQKPEKSKNLQGFEGAEGFQGPEESEEFQGPKGSEEFQGPKEPEGFQGPEEWDEFYGPKAWGQRPENEMNRNVEWKEPIQQGQGLIPKNAFSERENELDDYNKMPEDIRENIDDQENPAMKMNDMPEMGPVSDFERMLFSAGVSERQQPPVKEADIPQSWTPAKEPDIPQSWTPAKEPDIPQSWTPAQDSDIQQPWSPVKKTEVPQPWTPAREAENLQPWMPEKKEEYPQSWMAEKKEEYPQSWMAEKKEELPQSWMPGEEEEKPQPSVIAPEEEEEKPQPWTPEKEEDKSQSWLSPFEVKMPQPWAAAKETEIPQKSQTFEKEEELLQTSVPVTEPENVQIPATEESTETIETPEIPETTEAQQVPETPEIPETTEAQQVPVTPEVPETQEVSQKPEPVEMPELIESAEMPESPVLGWLVCCSGKQMGRSFEISACRNYVYCRNEICEVTTRKKVDGKLLAVIAPAYGTKDFQIEVQRGVSASIDAMRPRLDEHSMTLYELRNYDPVKLDNIEFVFVELRTEFVKWGM